MAEAISFDCLVFAPHEMTMDNEQFVWIQKERGQKINQGEYDPLRARFPLLVGSVNNVRVQNVACENWRSCAREDSLVVLIDTVGRNCRLDGCFVVCQNASQLESAVDLLSQPDLVGWSSMWRGRRDWVRVSIRWAAKQEESLRGLTDRSVVTVNETAARPRLFIMASAACFVAWSLLRQ